jgi:hypothetical protein
VGGVGIDKEPSGFSVHLISLRNSSETSNRGALSMPKRSNQDDSEKSKKDVLTSDPRLK